MTHAEWLRAGRSPELPLSDCRGDVKLTGRRERDDPESPPDLIFRCLRCQAELTRHMGVVIDVKGGRR